jgi:GntR family transcriptional repressor for pyruvate dehydrogenase complex
MDNKALFEPIKKIRLSDRVVKQFKDIISSQKVSPGERLGSERDICKRFNISRSVLREALSSLEVQGFITTNANGIFVQSIAPIAMKEAIEQLLTEDEAKFISLTEMRKVLESGMAELAIQRATPEDFEKVKEALADLERAYSNREIGDKENVKFHLALAESTHNPIYIHSLYSFLDLLQKGALFYRSRLLNKPPNAEILIEQHRKIYHFFLSKDANGLSKAIIEHLSWAEEEIKRYIT